MEYTKEMLEEKALAYPTLYEWEREDEESFKAAMRSGLIADLLKIPPSESETKITVSRRMLLAFFLSFKNPRDYSLWTAHSRFSARIRELGWNMETIHTVIEKRKDTGIGEDIEDIRIDTYMEVFLPVFRTKENYYSISEVSDNWRNIVEKCLEETDIEEIGKEINRDGFSLSPTTILDFSRSFAILWRDFDSKKESSRISLLKAILSRVAERSGGTDILASNLGVFGSNLQSKYGKQLTLAKEKNTLVVSRTRKENVVKKAKVSGPCPPENILSEALKVIQERELSPLEEYALASFSERFSEEALGNLENRLNKLILLISGR